MAQTIAFAGKGGVGKTTICGMLIEYLCERHNGAVLAVDARNGADITFNLVVRKQIVGRDNRQIGNHAVIGFAGGVLVARADSKQLVFISCCCHAAKFQAILIGIDVVDIIFALFGSCICLAGHGKGDEVPFVV